MIFLNKVRANYGFFYDIQYISFIFIFLILFFKILDYNFNFLFNFKTESNLIDLNYFNLSYYL